MSIASHFLGSFELTMGDFTFDLKTLAQGVYFAQVEAGNTTKTTKLVWLK